ncbi:unnamed protein product [Ilex paraguariensis]|uniref:Uncharacterized protein n=1 Tax=Ilex paraguariensis TaxID=185542 RepID=A0ABC8RHH7_9AQUA
MEKEKSANHGNVENDGVESDYGPSDELLSIYGSSSNEDSNKRRMPKSAIAQTCGTATALTSGSATAQTGGTATTKTCGAVTAQTSGTATAQNSGTATANASVVVGKGV